LIVPIEDSICIDVRTDCTLVLRHAEQYNPSTFRSISVNEVNMVISRLVTSNDCAVLIVTLQLQRKSRSKLNSDGRLQLA